METVAKSTGPYQSTTAWTAPDSSFHSGPSKAETPPVVPTIAAR